MTRFAWVELIDQLDTKIKNNDDSHLQPLLNNVRALNESYDTKEHFYGASDQRIFEKIDFLIYELEELIKQPASKDQVIKKIQLLNQVITDAQALGIRPLMSDQIAIMSSMHVLGYKIRWLGECYGVAHMATQAFLADDLVSFNQRLHLIHQLFSYDALNHFEQLIQKKKSYLANAEYRKAKEVNDILNDLYAFFDGVVLYQLPQVYLHDEKMQPLSKKQNALKTRPIVQSIALEKEPYVPEHIAFLTGTYTESELKEYLDLMVEKMGDCSFALSLECCKHAIALFFDAKTKHWMLVNPNSLPPEEYVHTQYLSAALFKGFMSQPQENDVILMSTQMTTTGKYKQRLKQQFDDFKNDLRWKEIYHRRKDFQDAKGFTVDTMYQFLHEDDPGYDDGSILYLSFCAGKYDVVIDYIKMYGVDVFTPKNVSFLSQLLLILPQDRQQQLLNRLLSSKKAAIFSHYATRPLIAMFILLPTQEEQLAVFNHFSPEKQAYFLLALIDSSMVAHKDFFLKNMSIEQQQKIITYYRKKNDILNDMVSARFFQLLPWGQQLSLFLRLRPIEQVYVLRKLQLDGAPLLQEALWQATSVRQKSRMARYDRFTQKHLETDTDETLHSLFWRSHVNQQMYLLEKLVSYQRGQSVYRLLNQCTPQKKMDFIKQECRSNIKNPKTFVLIIACLPEALQGQLFNEAYGCNNGRTIGDFLSSQAYRTGFFNGFLNVLSVESRLNFIQKWPLDHLKCSKTTKTLVGRLKRKKPSAEAALLSSNQIKQHCRAHTFAGSAVSFYPFQKEPLISQAISTDPSCDKDQSMRF